ncbi:MAG: hydantoinase/oxoprolinase family protein [Bacteroidales bacterium]
MNRYLIGIDTGGTFTDGVLLNYTGREVVSTAKSLTTRKNLEQGVIKVLKKLDIPPDCSIRLVGISSTLATNSIAEGKARKVASLLIGYKPELLENYGLHSDLATDTIHFVKGGHTAQGAELAPLDKRAVREWIRQIKHKVDAIAVSGYFSPLNPEHERQALKIISAESGLPVVLGHQLSSRLNSIKRAATAAINASLVAVMQEFLQAVQNALDELEIQAPLMIVRGDGTLMPYKEALQKPVETVLSGPAASAIGARFLSGETRSLVIDMGSTTTDMVIMENSGVMVSENGAKIGDTETAVEAARIRTISLGCDSRISIDEKTKVHVGPERVRALSQVSLYYPAVKAIFSEMEDTGFASLKTIYDLEFWHLYQPLDKQVKAQLNERQKAVAEKLSEPRQLSRLMDEFKVFHPEQLEMGDLIHQGYIESSMFNPTDLLHANGAMELWDRNVAGIATRAFCKLYGLSQKELTEYVIERVQSHLLEEILLYLAAKDNGKADMPAGIDGKWGKWILQELLSHNSELMTLEMTSKLPIIGSGAPARHFLKAVAGLINTRLYLPRHAEVANAVGAVSGLVSETRESIVFIRENHESYTYQVKYASKIKKFDSYEAACEFAEKTAADLARKAVVKAGGADSFNEVQRRVEGSLTRFIARAAGNPKLSKSVGKGASV